MSEEQTENRTFVEIQNEILDVIRTIYDPEIPVNIYDLGLIYDVKVNPDNSVKILMTLTAPNCPAAEILPAEVKQKVEGLHGVKDVDLELTFDPPWEMSMMSEEAKLELGFL
jgi:FeS assembly SUF system protein